MTPVEELDLARAKTIFTASFTGATITLDQCNEVWREHFVDIARAIRLGDEERGLRVVPVEATEAMFRACTKEGMRWEADNLGAPLPDVFVWDAMLAASPFAPEEK
jgi:hypothetical protein